MAVFTVTSNDVLLGTGAVGANDPFHNGVLKDNGTGTLNRATLSDGAYWSNGIFRNAAGQLQYADYTAGLPTPTYWVNGLPYDSAGALCISTDAEATYSNGIPFAANGAVAAGIIPS